MSNVVGDEGPRQWKLLQARPHIEPLSWCPCDRPHSQEPRPGRLKAAALWEFHLVADKRARMQLLSAEKNMVSWLPWELAGNTSRRTVSRLQRPSNLQYTSVVEHWTLKLC